LSDLYTTKEAPLTKKALLWLAVVVLAACDARRVTAPDAPDATAVQLQAAGGAPKNDEFTNAFTISTLPYENKQQQIQNATSPSTDPTQSCGFDPRTEHTVWYTFTPSQNLTIDANTFGSKYDTVLDVYTYDGTNFTEVTCNDDAPTTLQSEVTFAATGGTTYYFMIGSFRSVGHGRFAGHLVFSVRAL
jgi:hypothetical protein